MLSHREAAQLVSHVQPQGHSDAGSHVPKVMSNLTVFRSTLRDTSNEELVRLGDGHGPVPAVWEQSPWMHRDVGKEGTRLPLEQGKRPLPRASHFRGPQSNPPLTSPPQYTWGETSENQEDTCVQSPLLQMLA